MSYPAASCVFRVLDVIGVKRIFGSIAFAPILLLWACNGGGGGSPAPAVQGTGSPVARIDLSLSRGGAPLTVQFDGTGSSDPDGGSLSFLWQLGNGKVSIDAVGLVTYQTPGFYEILLTVTDAAGLEDQDQSLVSVEELVPVETPADRVLYLTNLERRNVGLPPLKGEVDLDAAALGHAFDMAVRNYFDHESLDGRQPWDRVRDEGYSFQRAGENIAAGQPTAESVLRAWMDSPAHRLNILDPEFRELGAGYYFEFGDTFPGPEGFNHYWVQEFGLRPEVYPVVINSDAFETSDTVVELYIYGAGVAAAMKLSEDAGFRGAPWQVFESERLWLLSPDPGLKRIYVRLQIGVNVQDSFDEISLR